MVPVSILLVCPEGIHFTESDQMVYLLFCFASTGERDDLEMLKAIIRLGQTPARPAALPLCAIRTPCMRPFMRPTDSPCQPCQP